MGFLDELKRLAKPYGEDEEYDDFDEEEKPAKRRETTSFDFDKEPEPASPVRRMPGGSKVVNINATAQMQVVLVKPDRFDNVSDIADHLRSKHAVVLNLEKTSKDVSRRLVDFLSGCAYALDGKIKKIAISTYIITPYNVDIIGDLIDELENSGLYL